ncbi:lob domain-containing protein 36 [Quercus suber]|uniref:Lob domain-containing protein 36 n=1 Tax=Quercus suber TaxID=58331 RepID=A0AAW0J9L4_QUESU
MSSSNSPCAACKFLRRKCTQECVFAPYFPPDQPQKFANVHKVFGASNVAKLLNELNAAQREDAVNSLAYEAEARLRDPVYGCVGLISILQHRLKQVQTDLYNAKKELATYIGPQAMLPILQPPGYIPQQHHPGNPSSSGQQQPELVRFNTGFDPAGAGSVTASGYNQMNAAAMSPSLALGTYETPYQIQTQQGAEHHHPHHQLQAQLLLQPQQTQAQQQGQQTQPQQPKSESEEGRSVARICRIQEKRG